MFTDIMTYRELICDNLSATHNVRRDDIEFILAIAADHEPWTVTAGRNLTFNPGLPRGVVLHQTSGCTPEMAYRKLLFETAAMVEKQEYHS
ncbi:hypothetical protein KCU93_g9498, partial [Aureobasidium melanogenum]